MPPPWWVALGMPFQVESLEAGVEGRLHELFRGFEQATEPEFEARMFTIPEESETEPHRLAHLLTNINLTAIQAAAGNLLLHAGAACRSDGRSVVLCGPSGSGKTTLTAELVSGGLAYLTDETVCIDPEQMRVTPFRKPLSLKLGAQPLFPQLRPDDDEGGEAPGVWLVAPDDLGGVEVPKRPLLPALLVFPTHRPGASLQVERIQEARAAYLLGKETSRLNAVRGGALHGLARLARRAPAYTVVHGGGGSASRAVRELLDAA